MAGIAPISSGGYHPLLQNQSVHSAHSNEEDGSQDYFEKTLGISDKGEDYGKEFSQAFTTAYFGRTQHIFQVNKQQMDDLYADLETPPKNNKHRG
jgi:hypothetical protein